MMLEYTCVCTYIHTFMCSLPGSLVENANTYNTSKNTVYLFFSITRVRGYLYTGYMYN